MADGFARLRDLLEKGYGLYSVDGTKGVLERVSPEFVKKELVDERSLRLFLNRKYSIESIEYGKPVYHEFLKSYYIVDSAKDLIFLLELSSTPSVKLSVNPSSLEFIQCSTQSI